MGDPVRGKHHQNVKIQFVNHSEGGPTLNAVDKQLKRIAEVFGEEEPPEVKEKTLKIFLKHLKQNVEFPCVLTGSEDFEWEEFYILGPGSKEEHKELRKEQASYLDTFDLIDFVIDPDGDEGLHAQVRRLSDKKIFILPLDYLKVKPRKSKNFELVSDYGVWFVNYR